jgi:hypothetical protein
MGNSNKIIVAFHTGRGGRFHNAGHVTFIGEKNFQDLISMNSNNLFERNKDERGKFCKPYLTDGSGNHITDDDIKGEVGLLSFDGKFDSDGCCYIEDCSEFQLELIAKSNEYKSYELREWLSNYNPDWKFDKYGFLEVTEEV